ncbi:reverse transcriptase-like protein [Peribacillus deserti]|uniref:Ribonuclease HI n=1 Tax=Peribacillus deserti TaxID=673318 RepID=A0A2N5M255_9BACI|nr:reverse transcriptase-like protein [Peribacillus deserti]PLT28395.1 ribonuclease HI [Peribacillus deserti]
MVEIYIDGASAGNPGPSGAGIFIKNEGQTETYSFPLGIMENHEAEYWALIKGLEICIQRNYSLVSFRTDSDLIFRSMEKEFVKNKKYAGLLEKALALSKQLDLFFIKWVPRSENKADSLSRKAILEN